MTSMWVDVVRRRCEAAGIGVSDELADGLAGYLTLLARWNRRINLTAFNLDVPTDAAIDRLIVEAIAAARWVPAGPLRAVDIGSGGGSPAIPLKLARPALRLVLVEARTRKAAFLREAVRSLGLVDVRVEASRFEALCAADVELYGAVDLVTVRAVRADPVLWAAVVRVLKPSGLILWFADVGQITEKILTEFDVVDSAVGVVVLRRA
jgi:16S rRNA (guanine527-N7)-methyltransferase